MPQPGSQTLWSLSLGSNKQLPHRSGRMVVDTSPGVTRPGIDLIGTIQVDGFLRKGGPAGPWRACSTLAGLAMAHVDHHRLSRDNDTEGATQTLGGSRHIRCPL